MLAVKFYVTDHSSNAMSSCHKALTVVRISSERSKQRLDVHTAQFGLHTCITFTSRGLTTQYNLLHNCGHTSQQDHPSNYVKVQQFPDIA